MLNLGTKLRLRSTGQVATLAEWASLLCLELQMAPRYAVENVVEAVNARKLYDIIED